MSDIISKSKVLDWLNEQRKQLISESHLFELDALESVISKIQSGAFDVQRLRAALERIGNICREHLEAKYEPISTVRLIQQIVKQSLAPTPTEPSGEERVKALWSLNTEENNRADEEYLAGIVDTLNALGYRIPGINAPEGDGNVYENPELLKGDGNE